MIYLGWSGDGRREAWTEGVREVKEWLLGQLNLASIFDVGYCMDWRKLGVSSALILVQSLSLATGYLEGKTWDYTRVEAAVSAHIPTITLGESSC